MSHKDNNSINKNEVIGVVPSGRCLKTLNNKNNLEELYLKKRLTQYNREMTFSISHMDKEKFDTKDFLRNITQIDSDSHPAAVQYLGRDPNKRSYFHPIKRLPRHVPKLAPQPENSEEQSSVHTPNFNEARRALMKSPVREGKTTTKESGRESINTVIPQIDRKQSVYLQIASVMKNPEQLSDSDGSNSDSDVLSTERTDRKRPSMRRRSFMAWIQEKQMETTEDGYLLAELHKMKPEEKRRRSFSRWLKARELVQDKTKTDLLALSRETTHVGNEPNIPIADTTTTTTKPTSSFKSFGDVVKSMVGEKPSLGDRLHNFYGKVKELKVDNEIDENARIEAARLKKRRWTLLTKGVKAALNESDEDEDDGEDFSIDCNTKKK